MQLFAEHGVALELFLLEKFRHIRIVYRQHVVRQDVLREIKPELRHLGQDSALVRNLVLQNVVKSRNTVCCHHDDAAISLIHFTDFTRFERFVGFHELYRLP